MKIKVLHHSAVVWSVFVLFLPAEIAFADKSDKCHVIGDTSNSDPSKSLGSNQNPYGSLADVEADANCDTIIVVYSSVVLDGGITLADGQDLKGKKGPRKALPIISNTTGSNGGNGVQLGANNSIDGLHITDTQNSGVSGTDVGNLTIKNSLITGFALSEEIAPAPPPLDIFMVSRAGIEVSASDDVKIRISKTELGEANSGSIGIVAFEGHADVVIEDVSVRDQGVTAGSAITPGISVLSLGSSSVDLKVQNTSVSNIGAGSCNCDGMLFIAVESSAMDVLVDGYSYINPDGDGGGSATGMEIANFFGVGASMDVTVKNSTFKGGTSTAIQLGDFRDGNGNFLTAHVHDNVIIDARFDGIGVGIGVPNGTDRITIENNLIVNPGFAGIRFDSFISQQTLVEMLIQKNRIINAGFFGLAFIQEVGASATSLNLDAGLGGLGSQGKNRVIDSQVADIYVEAFDCCGFPPTPPFTVEAANNWWGSDTGPATVIELNGATVDVTPFLTKEPKDKKKKKKKKKK
jgi:hypothetical protein